MSNADPALRDPSAPCAPIIQVEDDRTSYSPEGFRRGILDHLNYSMGKDDAHATQYDRYMALAHAVRDRVTAKWMRTKDAYRKQDPKRVYYLSAEFLLGRALSNNLHSLGLYDTAQKVLDGLGLPLSDLLDQERDAGLGNGGLGRLAACYLDSMATLGLPAYGYGIRYEFGIFDQVIRNGAQIERPEEWLRNGCPWMMPRPEFTQPVHFYGHTEIHGTTRPQVRWVDTTSVLGVPFDMPICGFRTDTVNTLRLWSARASEEFDLTVFNAGDYERAVFDKNNSESISKVLYPNDLLIVGKELRLKQQYFFVACAIADLLRRHTDHARDKHDPQAVRDRLLSLPDKVAIQLNDTHPSIAIAELLRLLIDKYALPWETAWQITESVFAYTNHTLLPEALEVWSVDLLGKLLRTGKTPSGAEAAGHIRRLVRHLRRHWPETHITIRGDGHYGQPEVMAFCEAAGVDYVFGLPTNAALRADPEIVAAADACAVKRAQRQYPVLRNYAETRYGAKSWNCQPLVRLSR